MNFFTLRIAAIAVLAIIMPLSGAHAQVSYNAGGAGGGAVIVGEADSLTCDAATGGALRFNNTPDCIEFCDGAGTWACMGGCTVTWDTFADLTNQPKSTTLQSSINLVTTSGCSPDVTISGDGSPQYRICADATCSASPAFTASSGTIDSGDYIQAQMTSSASAGATNTATVTIGKAATEWTVTTSSTPEFVAAATATSGGTVTLTINKPAGTAEDNLMIAALARDDGGCSMSAPVGWTEIRQGNMTGFGSHSRYAHFYKVATAGEPASYGFSICDDGESVAGAIITISGNSTSSPIDTNDDQSGDSASPTAPSITTTVDNTLLVAIAASQSGSAHSPPASYTERANETAGSGGTGASVSIATRVQSIAGASGTAVFSAGNEEWHTEHIAVRAP